MLLTLEHNKLIQQAEQTGRRDGSRQRAQQKAQQKGEELRKARSREEQLARDLHQKETDIADVIAALLVFRTFMRRPQWPVLGPA